MLDNVFSKLFEMLKGMLQMKNPSKSVYLVAFRNI